MSGNLWMFSDKLDDEDIEILKHEFITYYQGADYYGLGMKMFTRLAHEAGTVYKIGKKVLIRRTILDAWIVVLNCSVEGSAERTEVYVVSEKDFVKWYEASKSFPNEGSNCVRKHHFWHKKTCQNRVKNTWRQMDNFQSAKNPCGSKEIRFQKLTISGEQSRHTYGNSPIQGALR